MSTKRNARERMETGEREDVGRRPGTKGNIMKEKEGEKGCRRRRGREDERKWKGRKEEGNEQWMRKQTQTRKRARK